MTHSQDLISPEEKWERYLRMRREYESELTNLIHGLTTSEEVVAAQELSGLWRLSCEGIYVTEPTWEQMIEATEQ